MENQKKTALFEFAIEVKNPETADVILNIIESIAFDLGLDFGGGYTWEDDSGRYSRATQVNPDVTGGD